MKKLINNTILLSLSFLIGRGLSILWNGYLARVFSGNLEELGIYLFIVTQFSVISILAEGNVKYTVQHFISKKLLTREEAIEKFWYFSLILKLLYSIVFSFILFIIIIEQYPAYWISALWVSLSLIAFNLGSAPIGLFISQNTFKPQIISYLLNSILFTIGAAVSLIFIIDISVILFLLFISNLISALYMLRKGFIAFGKPDKEVNILGFKSTAKEFLKFSIPLMVSSFCYSFFYRIDINLTAKQNLPEYVSYISYALMLFFLVGDFLWSQLATAMTPDLLRKWSSNCSDDRRKSIDQLLTLLSIYSIISVLSILFLEFFGKYFIELFLGSNGGFAGVIPILENLMLGLPFMVSYAYLYRVFLLHNRTFKFMLFSITFLVLKILIVTYYPKLDYYNYSLISTLLLIVVFACFILFMKILNQYRNRLLRFLANLLVIFILMLVYMFYIEKSGTFSIFYKLLISILIFAESVLLLRQNLMSDELLLFKQKLIVRVRKMIKVN